MNFFFPVVNLLPEGLAVIYPMQAAIIVNNILYFPSGGFNAKPSPAFTWQA